MAGQDDSRGYDLFLSHGSPDKAWVRTLHAELDRLGLRVFLDENELVPGRNWVEALQLGLLESRALALVVSRTTAEREWVLPEWTAYMAEHGPRSGRLIPVVLDAVELPTLLKPIQAIDATHRDAARAAAELAALIGKIDELSEGDLRRLFIGQDLVFVVQKEGDSLSIADPTGRRRVVDPPWAGDARFGLARHFFDRMAREPVVEDGARAELTGHAATLGGMLFDLLFDAEGVRLLEQATRPGRPRPLVSVLSDDDALLALPWELLHRDGRFLVRDGDLDLARSVPGEVGRGALLPRPTGPFSLVVNVSAPEGSGLDYEGESYRITRALADHCPYHPTELGTLVDLINTVREHQPTGIHFSGHGAPGRLVFEDDEGRADPVAVGDLLDRLRGGISDGLLPPFFYLANCHGNDPDPGEPEKGEAGSPGLAAQLHRAGVAQVVGYRGPILDHLSTAAEAALYAAIADGHTTRFAVRQARAAMLRPQGDARALERGPAAAQAAERPFAWAQLVLYHRGHDYPLSVPPPPGGRRAEADVPRRAFLDAGTRRILTTGFIGRRRELHGLRRRVREEGQRVFVFQGLGGLGKSTLALHMIREILHAGDGLCTLWCQDAEKADSDAAIAEALVGQLLGHCRGRFGAAWEQVVQQVDRAAVDDPAQRFEFYLGVLLEKVNQLVVYLDNLESLLVGPEEVADRPPDPAAFADWRTPALGAIWSALVRAAEGSAKLHVVASCRYRNGDFRGGHLFPVSPLPPDALFRLMGWFEGLSRLSADARARLVGRLDGHPRAVEYADDLVRHALDRWEDEVGPWRKPADAEGLALEWDRLVAPALPEVTQRLWDDLLLARIWDHVLDDPARRMLSRMTLLRIPWDWDLAAQLGDEGEPEGSAVATAGRLRATSLLEQVELPTAKGPVRRFTIHPATAQYVGRRHSDDEALRRAAHLRLGRWYEARARTSPYLDDDLEAGHHLFRAGQYEAAFALMGPSSELLRQRGRVLEGLKLLEPFLAEVVLRRLPGQVTGPLLGTVGLAYADLGQAQRAIGYYEQRLAVAREVGDRRGEGAALGNLGLAYAALGQAQRAIGYYEQRLAVAREVGDRRGEGNALGNLGNAYAALGQAQRAIGYHEQVLSVMREVGDRRGEGATLGNLGNAYAALGQAQRAIGYHEQALAISREVGDRRGEGNALGNLGLAYAALGQAQRAIGYHEQALSVLREIKDRRAEGAVLGNLGNAYAALGQAQRAIGYHEQALAISREVGDRRSEAQDLGNLGNAYAALGQAQRAIGYLQDALAIGREVQDPRIVEAATKALERLGRGGDSTTRPG